MPVLIVWPSLTATLEKERAAVAAERAEWAGREAGLVQARASLELRLEELQASLQAEQTGLEAARAKAQTRVEEHQTELASLVSRHSGELARLQQEWAEERQGLQLELELVGVQRSEFEDEAARLGQELRDGLEERKISEKKGSALVKEVVRYHFTHQQKRDKSRFCKSYLESTSECGSGN